jgi:hypothetical protein
MRLDPNTFMDWREPPEVNWVLTKDLATEQFLEIVLGRFVIDLNGLGIFIIRPILRILEMVEGTTIRVLSRIYCFLCI